MRVQKSGHRRRRSLALSLSRVRTWPVSLSRSSASAASCPGLNLTIGRPGGRSPQFIGENPYKKEKKMSFKINIRHEIDTLRGECVIPRQEHLQHLRTRRRKSRRVAKCHGKLVLCLSQKKDRSLLNLASLRMKMNIRLCRSESSLCSLLSCTFETAFVCSLIFLANVGRCHASLFIHSAQ